MYQIPTVLKTKNGTELELRTNAFSTDLKDSLIKKFHKGVADYALMNEKDRKKAKEIAQKNILQIKKIIKRDTTARKEDYNECCEVLYYNLGIINAKEILDQV